MCIRDSCDASGEASLISLLILALKSSRLSPKPYCLGLSWVQYISRRYWSPYRNFRALNTSPQVFWLLGGIFVVGLCRVSYSEKECNWLFFLCLMIIARSGFKLPKLRRPVNASIKCGALTWTDPVIATTTFSMTSRLVSFFLLIVGTVCSTIFLKYIGHFH